MPELLGDFRFVWPYYAGALGGYLLGSIPFGLILTRLAGLGDIRRIGSGNIGATNVLRTGNKALAALTLLFDGGKGAAAVLIGANWGPDLALLAGGGALAGHLFPLWLRFRGGKGVATALGVLLALAWPVGVGACLTWLAVAVFTRYSSLSALLALAGAPALSWFIRGDLQLVEFTGGMAIVIWLTHARNIARLLTGTESKIGRRSSGTTP